MMKFKLSKNIAVTSITESEEFEVPLQYKNDHYILYDQRRDKDFLINSTVKYYLDKFSFPKTQAEVLQEIAEDVQGKTTQLEEACATFFNFLCKKNILIPENTVETENIAEPVYKEGDNIDEGTIVEVLSERDYVDIYRAVNTSTGFAYVIKSLNSNKTNNQQRYQKELVELEREYLALKSVDHIPSVCKAYSFYKGDELNAYITLEYIEGKSLSTFLNDAEGLHEADCLRLIEHILHAFSLLHNSKVIHGDIHSSNIMVLENKSIKIIDLGLSRNVETDKNEVLSFGGVNFYMPPERINITSSKKYLKEPDLYSDVYQIGLLMYLVLYNNLPFDGFIWEELAVNIKETDAVFADMSFLNYRVSDTLILIIQKCLNKVPAERYRSASDIFEDFKKLVLKKTEQHVN